MALGRLITIEGIDGSGKTTLSLALEQALIARGLRVRLLREPGGVRAAERVRAVLSDPKLRIGPRAEALLYAGARAQLVEEAIRPLLSAGTWVLLDRFIESSLAYQGAGRALGLEAVKRINEFATGGLVADRTLLLTIDPAVGRARSKARGKALDRLEREPDDFFAHIASAYLELARAEPERIRVIDATPGPDRVLSASLSELGDLL